MDLGTLPNDHPGTERVSTGVLPSDTDVQAVVSAGDERFRHLDEGTVADYIPALAAASPSGFGVCVAGVRGQLFSIGDADQEFAIESISKLFVFALICHTLGHEEARRKLGVNSTGLPFNSVMAIELNADRTMNPLVNAGAMATTSLVPGTTADEKFVFDTSGSMGPKLEKSRQSVSEFFKTANPEDEAFLVEFNDRPELVTPLTHNLEEIQNRLTFTQSKGRTALLDGVLLALRTMKKAHNPRKALIVISDGGDNSSRYTESELKSFVKEADVQIYAIGIYEPVSSRGRTPEELAGPGLLTDISEPTGGRHFVVENLNELPDVAAKIGIELRNQYVLGYSPSNAARDGKYRKVKVKINQPRGLPSFMHSGEPATMRRRSNML